MEQCNNRLYCIGYFGTNLGSKWNQFLGCIILLSEIRGVLSRSQLAGRDDKKTVKAGVWKVCQRKIA
jgi:hypothetical protein